MDALGEFVDDDEDEEVDILNNNNDDSASCSDPPAPDDEEEEEDIFGEEEEETSSSHAGEAPPLRDVLKYVDPRNRKRLIKKKKRKIKKRIRKEREEGEGDEDGDDDSSDCIDSAEEERRLVDRGSKYTVAFVGHKLEPLFKRTRMSKKDREDLLARVSKQVMRADKGRKDDDDPVVASKFTRNFGRASGAYEPHVISNRWDNCLNPGFSAAVEKFGPPKQSDCWGCQRGMENSARVSHRALQTLKTIFYDNYGKMNDDDLATQMGIYFETKIRARANAHLKPGQEPVPEWSGGQILWHMNNHTNDPVIRTSQTLSQLNNIKNTIYNNTLFTSNYTDGWVTGVNTPELSNYLKVTDALQKLYHSNPNTMFGAPKGQRGGGVGSGSGSEFICSKPAYTGEHEDVMRQAYM